MSEIIIDGRTINDDADCFVISEIGNNHQGELDKAKDMFRVSKECGVDAVKLQKRDNKTLFTKELYDSSYDHENSFGKTYGSHREALEFGKDEYLELKKYAKEIGLTMFATAFDFNSVDFLEDVDMPAYKVASADLKNTPLLKYIAQTKKPMIVSTGGGTIEDVRRAYDLIMPINSQLCILQCTASYPVDPADMHLRVIETYRKTFPDVVVGLSDHENGIAMALVAYILGARVVEKHFTLNRSWKGTDHAFSLAPHGLERLVRDLKRARVALGDAEKKPLPSEEKPLFKMSKKLVAAGDLAAGTVLTREGIAVKSPSDGLPPFEMDNIIGKKLKRDLKPDENITFEDLE